MATIPTRKAEQLAFFESHWPVWTNSPASLGLSAPAVAAFKTLTQTARASFDAAETARNAAKSATLTQDSDLDEAFNSCSDLIRIIRAYAESQANPNTVYAAADIPAPATPQPTLPPGTCKTYSATILDGGSLQINWKCTNPPGTSGVVYEVRRRIAMGEYVFIGAVGTKKFIDNTLPAGSSTVTYQVTGTRGNQRGVSSSFNVTFGVGGGFATVTVSNVKLAA